MASGSMLGDDAKEKHRSAQSNKKFHSRKNQKPKNPNLLSRRSSQTLVAPITDNNDSSPPHHFLRVDDAAGSNDLSYHDHPLPRGSEQANENGFPGYMEFENRVRISLDSRSKMDIRELRRKLLSELDQVRCLVKKLESKEFQLSGYSHSQFSANYAVDNMGSTERLNSGVGLKGPRDSRLFRGLSDSVAENNHGVVGEVGGKKKKKKLPTPESDKKMKTGGGKKDELRGRFLPGKDKYSSQLFNSCSDLLGKLMKHKFGWIFNVPVDVKGLGLHDYHTIVKHPMDLGTVKTRLNKGWYKSPMEFAEDVRLTFHNAMFYNPKGQDAYFMAEQLLKIFEPKWLALEAEYNLNKTLEVGKADLPTPASRKVQNPATAPPRLPPRPASPPPMSTLDRSESHTKPVDPKLKPEGFGHVGRTPVPKKPKAKDPDKRDMTYEEKQKLSANLQNLPSEKLDNVVQIIKKRNPRLFQQEDEIEVDIANVDPETLWELDRFVTNYKKSLSKIKRKNELALQSRTNPVNAIQETNLAPSAAEAQKEAETVENNVTEYSPVGRVEKGDDVSRASSSGGSGTDAGSSSSDSDSDS
ncbi:hypothetical protein FEM48_Zijuj12G0111300 [Ziziphus jujuba var. spinosa]|uniref:Transcription factor GTE4-like n=1 Tax=Ziziphus jujuba var. spinosa TaxID=714518 RepID=A0A978UCY7_ZIZJJ|nr:transcription factor GTE3, chloroplastic [Ziziphus jujuba var. spinosa]KAH7512630.1 hypothetical protein FEM48_Zijuj12G0111300 [Ziziphus jujuba var. spinosa]